ncbi:glutamyl aminopeptidase-like [Dendronephthya gigantea]|uniref:glutamyl aminopeptidase-like n=1 Tax=Dendronephthya gigantea TaxID=151771 RepID=UPI00106C8D4B|nr:glutamyl aminopeptidase-like [Dendronephthya gigantea]
MSSSSKSNMVIDDGIRSKARNNRMIIFVVAVVFVIIIVGVLSGVLSANREKDKCDERVKEAVRAAKEGAGGENATKSPEPTKSKSTKPPITTKPTPKTTPASNEPWDEIRLPSDVVPIHYDMLIKVYLDTLNFSGNSNISINVLNPTDKILFHINKINITKVTVVKLDGVSLSIKREFSSPKRQFYVVILAKSLTAGKYTLMLDFVANIETKELNGFYKSTYKDSSGNERVLAATDFQPTDARKAFPCFDEPAMKATFTISIEHRDDYTALSNMNQVSSVGVGNNRHLTRFAKSVPMPTYLVGMIVSDFKYLEDKTGEHGNITLRTWATPLQYNDSDYALKIGKNVTTYLETYYGVPFPLPKQDMVALPDFNSGAMENWGIITYRETAMLYKPGVSSETNKQRVALVVSHELAHMWFGNLVSCKWWNDIWLNEGFASYVEYLGVHEAEPDWEFKEQFLTSDLHRAFRLDALASSHPIQVEVNDPEEIKTVFDSITYSKGASIIRMLSDFLTEEKFKDGLKNYLIVNKFGSAETKDLWAELSNRSSYNVTNLMETWTEQMGYPVINITRAGSGKGNADQKHFLLDPKAKVTEPSPFNYKWTVKLNYITEGNSNVKNQKIVWMNRSSVQFDWPKGEWIKANVGQYGYYRVNYQRENWEQLSNVLKNNQTVLSSADRTSLIDDAFNLARAGQLDYDIPLDLSSYIKDEDRYVPWRAFMTAIGFVDTMLSTQDSFGKFQKYMLDIISKKIVDVGWKNKGNDKHLEVYMRSLILSAACSYGNEEANKKAKNLFLGYLNNNETLDVDLKSMIYYHGIANTGYEEWDKLFVKFLNATVASEKSKLLYGLAGSKQPWVLQRFLRYSIQKDKVRDQDTVTVVSYVARNVVGRDLAWKFLKENWDIFYDRYAKSSFRFATVITSTTSWMNTKIDLEDVKAFFKSRKDLGSGKRSADQAIERIQSNIEWVERSTKTIADFLDKN